MKTRRNKVQNTGILLFINCLLIMSCFALIKKLTVLTGLIILLITGLVFNKYKSWRQKRYINASLSIIDTMTGEEFEEYLQLQFIKLGYKAKLTPLKADYGADLVLKKSGVKTVVQAKRWKSKVGIEAVQQAVASIRYYNADNAIVITNSYFTENAINLAKANNVTLIDRSNLLRKLNVELRCPKCNGNLRTIKGKYGDFLGCSNYPNCKYTKST